MIGKDKEDKGRKEGLTMKEGWEKSNESSFVELAVVTVFSDLGRTLRLQTR